MCHICCSVGWQKGGINRNLKLKQRGEADEESKSSRNTKSNRKDVREMEERKGVDKNESGRPDERAS